MKNKLIRKAHRIADLFNYFVNFFYDIYELIKFKLIRTRVDFNEIIPYRSGEYITKSSDVGDIIGRYYIANKRQILKMEYADLDVSQKMWDKEPYSGFVWSKQWSKVTNRVRPVDTDLKIAWEIGRFKEQAKVALSCGSSQIQKKIANDLRDFYLNNPPHFGVQWACSMDVSIRSVNVYLLVFHLWDSVYLRGNVSFIKSFFETHYSHVKRYNEWCSGYRNNHYLTNLLGLLVTSLALYQLTRNSKYANTILLSYRKMLAEIDFQFDNGKGHFEGSSGYHKYCCEVLLLFSIFLKEANIVSREEINEMIDVPLRSSLNVLNHLVKDGKLIIFGDNDSGSVIDLNFSYIEIDGEIYRDISQDGLYILDFIDRPFCLATFQNIQVARLSQFSLSYKVEEKVIKSPVIKKDELGRYWEMPTVNRGFFDVFHDENLGFVNLVFENGWVVCKVHNQKTGHAHNDEFTIQAFFDGFYYSLTLGTKSYSQSRESLDFMRDGFYNTVTDEMLTNDSVLVNESRDEDSVFIFESHTNGCCLQKGSKYLRIVSTDSSYKMYFSNWPFLRPRKHYSGYNLENPVRYID